MRAISLLKVN